MKILLVNVDSRWNMAIRKMYNYYRKEHDVEMVDLKFSGYPHKRTKVIDGTGYDKVFVSNIFDINKDRVSIINCPDVQFGGIGSNNPHLQLPCEIEMTDPFYYPDEDTSYGFITRGCIRNCWFCKVPKFEGKLKEYNTVESVVKHKKVKFLDNNILAYPDHMKVFQWLLDHPDIKCEFNQGLDFRLVNDENLDALSRLNYMGKHFHDETTAKPEAAKITRKAENPAKAVKAPAIEPKDSKDAPDAQWIPAKTEPNFFDRLKACAMWSVCGVGNRPGRCCLLRLFLACMFVPF